MSRPARSVPSTTGRSPCSGRSPRSSPGIVEKGRLTAEVEARLVELTALDAARAELMSVVTHELRTPLSIVRVYVDLLEEAAAAEAANPDAAEWGDAASDQLGRLDRLVDSILASVRGEGLTGLSRAPFDAVEAVAETVETLRLLLRSHPIRWDRPHEPMIAIGDETRFREYSSSCSRTSRSTRRPRTA